MKTLNLAFVGFGNVGQTVAKMLIERHDEIAVKYGRDVRVTAIITNKKGNIYEPQGIPLDEVLEDIEDHSRFISSRCTEMTGMQILQTGYYDCVVELSPLNIFTGQPAADHIRMAMERGRHAITANKGPVAWYYRELKDLADSKGVCFFHETVVMDGAPVFNMAENDLKLAKVTKVEGILNTTTNFILDEMAKGAEMDDILERGRARGFVEADPAMDIEGYDAAAKITALLNVLMDAKMTPLKVKRKGIEDITYDDIKAAAERGKIIKVICRGEVTDGGRVLATVGPEEVDKESLYATISGTTSVVSITTDLMGKLSLVEHDPEIEQTAYGVFGDILRLL